LTGWRLLRGGWRGTRLFVRCVTSRPEFRPTLCRELMVGTKRWVSDHSDLLGSRDGGRCRHPQQSVFAKKSLTIVTNQSLGLACEFGLTIHLFADTTYVKDGVIFKYYSGEGEGHAVGPEELKDLVEWLKQAVDS
jgi:hypothetical protein